MSSRQKLQDATGVLEAQPVIGILKIVQVTAPTDAQAGYAPGCIWINTSGAAGLIFYVNKGSNTSSNWLAIT